MQNLNELAQSYLAYEKVDISDFQRKARLLQSITGGIAEAYYKGVSEHIKRKVLYLIPDEFIEILEKFTDKHVEN